MSTVSAKEREVVGFFRQVLIVSWKNGLLFKRNISGTVCEIAVSVIFCFVVLLLRWVVDVTVYTDQSSTTNPSKPVITNQTIIPQKMLAFLL